MPEGTIPVTIPPWEALNLQLIAFPVEPKAGFNSNWWAEVTGVEPEEDIRKKNGERVVDGHYGDHGVKLEIEPLRTVWTSGPLMQAAVEDLSSVPTLGAFVPACDEFCELMGRWFAGSCPELNRIGFVGQLFLPQKTREDSYIALNDFLPSVKVDPNSSEFQYRINRKRPSAVIVGEDISRLQTWSVLRYRVDAQVGDGVQSLGGSIGCMVQLDINTPPQNKTPLQRASLPLILRELATMAKEIAVKGDIA